MPTESRVTLGGPLVQDASFIRADYYQNFAASMGDATTISIIASMLRCSC